MPNLRSRGLASRHAMQSVNGSFTFEAYLKPHSVPKHHVPILCAGVEGESQARCSAGLRWLSNFNQCYWGGAVRRKPGEKPTRFSTGHYVSISRLTKKTMGWRHLALVYDEENLTITVWLDHWQSALHRLEEPLPTNLNLWLNNDFEGLVDSARVIERALGVESFLRATTTELKNVSFDHPEVVFPRDAGHLSIKRNFGAVGDGIVDDTAAIQKAFRETANHQASGHTNVLYFPAGTYLVSDTVKWSRFLRVQGEGPQKTKIVLHDQSPGFDDPNAPKAVVAASAVPGRPGTNRAVNGSTIANWFHGFTVDTGEGNPGAIGVEYHSNNYGSLENVVIQSGDGAGVIGLDLTHKTNGPALIAKTKIRGFDIGIQTSHLEYSITMEDVELEGQNQCGIANGGNILALHRIRSRNAVPAIQSNSAFSLVTILNSEFSGGSPKHAAIEVGGGIYARNLAVSEYGKSIQQKIISWNPKRKPNFQTEEGATLTGYVDEFMSGPNGERAGHASHLSIEDPPTSDHGSLANDWVNVQDFAHLVSVTGKQEDWAHALEAAFATGKATVYFPRGGRYSVSRPVSVPATVKRLYGMDNGVQPLNKADRKHPDYPNHPVSLRIADQSDDLLSIESLSASIEHASNRPVLLQHARFIYRAQPGAGNVFIRDVVSPWWSFARGQSVWARQWNVESHATEYPCITANGTNIWSLGFKTEYQSQKLLATGGSTVEIYGSFIYPVVKGIPRDRPVFELVDSRLSAQWGLSIYGAGHFLQVRDRQDGVIRDTTIKDGKQIGPRFRFDFFSNQTNQKPSL